MSKFSVRFKTGKPESWKLTNPSGFQFDAPNGAWLADYSANLWANQFRLNCSARGEKNVKLKIFFINLFLLFSWDLTDEEVKEICDPNNSQSVNISIKYKSISKFI